MMITELFSAIDSKNVKSFMTFLSPDCVFKFGNMPEVVGTEAINAFVAGFFDSIDSLSHEIKDSWDIPGGLICHGEVAYKRKDGSVLSVPFSNIFKIDSAGVAEYLIFADTSQLYQ